MIRSSPSPVKGNGTATIKPVGKSTCFPSFTAPAAAGSCANERGVKGALPNMVNRLAKQNVARIRFWCIVCTIPIGVPIQGKVRLQTGCLLQHATTLYDYWLQGGNLRAHYPQNVASPTDFDSIRVVLPVVLTQLVRNFRLPEGQP